MKERAFTICIYCKRFIKIRKKDAHLKRCPYKAPPLQAQLRKRLGEKR